MIKVTGTFFIKVYFVFGYHDMFYHHNSGFDTKYFSFIPNIIFSWDSIVA